MTTHKRSIDDLDALRAQLPAPDATGFDSALHEYPPDDVHYGRLKVVGWLAAGDGIDKAKACAIFTARGLRYESVFSTARFWCAGVYQ